MKLYIVGIIVMLITCSKIHSQNFSVETIQNLDFGMFTSGSNGGTITLESDGQISASQDIIILSSSTTTPARFLATTLSIVPLNITVTVPSVYLVNQINQTVLFEPNRISQESFTISVLKPKEIAIGGQLIIPGKLPGLYSGTMNVEFTYNTQ